MLEFYGRDDERGVIAEGLAAAIDHRPRLLVLEGPPGSGRTTLLAEARAEGAKRGCTVLHGRALPLERAYSFGLMRQLFADVPGLSEGDLPLAGTDAELFDLFGTVFAGVRRLTERGPLLIAVDDVQWCDAASLRWLAYLARRCGDLPLALVTTYCPVAPAGDQLDTFLAHCDRQILEGLAEPVLEEWITNRLGVPPDQAFVTVFQRVTGGNVALVGELLEALEAEAIVPTAAAVGVVERLGKAGLAARLEQCPREAVLVAQVLTVLGDETDLVTLAEVSGMSVERVRQAADMLIGRRVLADGLPLRFPHSLMRMAVATSTPAKDRTAWHLKAGRLLRDASATPEQVAAHLLAIDRTAEPWVCEALKAAADAALADGLPEIAVAYLRRALKEPVAGAARAELLADLAVIEVAGELPGGEAHLEEALDLIDDPRQRALHLARLVANDPPDTASAALTILERLNPHSAAEAPLYWAAVAALVRAEALDEAAERCRVDARVAHPCGEAAAASVAALHRGSIARARGDLDRARAEYASALEYHDMAGTGWLTQRSVNAAELLRVLVDLGELDAAESLLADYQPPLARSDTKVFWCARGALRMARGHYADALADFRYAGQAADGLVTDQPWRSHAARCHLALGEAAAARALAEEELRLAYGGGPRALSDALATAGTVRGEVDMLREAVSVLNGHEADLHRARALTDLGIALVETGQVAAGEEHLQEAFVVARAIAAQPLAQRAARYIRRYGGRPDLSGLGGIHALTVQERAAAETAAAGATTREIADRMVLTQRTVEQYLTSAYRKLGITGRAQLPAALAG